MAILRAGPFASSSDSFLDEPTAATRSTLPVNCAKDTSSSSWPWKCYVLVDGSNDDLESYLSGFQSVSRTISESILLGDDSYTKEQLLKFPPVERPLVHIHPGSG